MASGRNKLPDFFSGDGVDPVESATGKQQPITEEKGAKTGMSTKKKAGFYLSKEILERFTIKFHELKLAGIAVDNKSALVELALAFALDDMDKGAKSRVLQRLRSR